MARIELSNIGGGGTTLSLTTTGTSGASTLAGSVLNIPVYQGQLTLTTTGTSGAATLSGDILNIPQYSGGGGTPAGSTGEIQYNNAGAFGASASLAWVNSPNPQLNIGAPSAPTGRLNVKGGGTTSSTVNLRLTDSGNTELLKVLDNGNTNIGTAFNWNNARGQLGISTSSQLTPIGIIQNSTGVSDLPGGLSSRAYGIVIDAAQSSTGSTLTRPGILMYVGRNDGSGINVDFFRALVGANGSYSSTVGAQFSAYSQAGNDCRYVYIGVNANNAFDSNSFRVSDNAIGVNLTGTNSVPSATIHARGTNTSSGTNALLVQNSTPSDLYKIENNGKISYLATNTAAGTTGAQTINRPSGTVNFGIGAGSLVVTNSLCTTSSIVFATVRTNDATAYIKNVVPAAGSFTINLGANATAETSVGFFIIN